MRNCDVVILLYSVTDKESFDFRLPDQENTITAVFRQGDKSEREPPLQPIRLLVGAKCDAKKDDWIKENLTEEYMKEYCERKGYLRWWESSAKENINVHKIFDYILDILFREEKKKIQKMQNNNECCIS